MTVDSGHGNNHSLDNYELTLLALLQESLCGPSQPSTNKRSDDERNKASLSMLLEEA